MRRALRLTALALAIALAAAFVVGTCNGDDDSADDETGDPTEQNGDDSEGENVPGGGPAEDDVLEEDTGTITLDGATTELSADDLGVCETVDSGSEGSFHIVTALADGTPFHLNGTVDDMDPELDGLFLGDTFDDERATDLEIERDDRTLSGTATIEAGELEFSFTC